MNPVHYDDEDETFSRLFWVSDIGLAAILNEKFKLIELDTKNPQRVAFGFVKTKDLEELVEKYWNSSLTVEPKVFSHQMLLLRKRIAEELNNN